ncbi:hypothetical protein AAC387_Pa11g0015 [Persea americana]
MEDENGIELSLGLSCGGSAGKSKPKDGSSDNKTDEGGSNKLMGGNVNVADVSLKHFFQSGFEKHESIGPQRSESSTQPQENFWTDLAKSSGQDAHLSSDMQGNNTQFARFQELWGANNRLTEVNEEKSSQLEMGGKVWTEASNKRKMPFEDEKNQKKHEAETEHVHAHSKSYMGINLLKNSHVSVTTEDGSSAENEDVAESEAEGSTSRLVSQHDDSSKQYKGGVSDVPKDKRGIADSHVIDTQVQKTSSAAGKQPGLELGNLTFGVPLPLQAQPSMSVPYSLPGKVPIANTTSISSGFSPVMHLMPPTSCERPIMQSMNPNSLQLAFGYSTAQLPTLETATVQAPHHVTEETGTCSSSQKDDETKGNNIFKPKETSDQTGLEGFPEGSAIRPGIAPGVKFGGCGSYPDLPWVSTTGPGPNGKTISGVTYQCGPNNQIRIVCACHSFHMSPDEFIQHARADAPNPENSSGLASFPNGNPAASAQS